MDPCLKRQILRMSLRYILCKKLTYKDIAEKYKMSPSTVSDYFNHKLPDISQFLYKKVRAKAEKQKSENRVNFKNIRQNHGK